MAINSIVDSMMHDSIAVFQCMTIMVIMVQYMFGYFVKIWKFMMFHEFDSLEYMIFLWKTKHLTFIDLNKELFSLYQIVDHLVLWSKFNMILVCHLSFGQKLIFGFDFIIWNQMVSEHRQHQLHSDNSSLIFNYVTIYPVQVFSACTMCVRASTE